MKIQKLFLLFVLFSCKDIAYDIQNWGQRYRKERQIKIAQEDIEKWKKDLEISEKESREIFTFIQQFAIEKKLQGELSWKIGKALMNQSVTELAQEYFMQSFEKQLEEAKNNSKIYESALVYYKKALKNYTPLPDLLFDAALCYGNASSALGWEEERFKTAIFLLERGMAIKPEDIRFPYTLAILLGKTTNSHKDVDRAIQLLNLVIQKDRYNIPSYFAKGNILVESGEFQEAFAVYEEITTILQEMYKKGLLQGDYTKNRKYLKAIENMKLLTPCIKGRKECHIKIEPE